MIRRYGSLLRIMLAVVDALAAAVALAIVIQFRFGTDWAAASTRISDQPEVLGLLYIFSWVCILWVYGLYRLRARWSWRSELWAVTQASVNMGILTFALLYALKVPDISRLFLLALIPAQLVLSAGARLLVRAILTFARREGRNTRYMVVVGTGQRAVEFAALVEGHPALGIQVLGFVGPAEGSGKLPRPLLGDREDLERILHHAVVDEVALCLDLVEWEEMERIIELCEFEGKVVRIPIAAPTLTRSAQYIDDIEGTMVMSLVQGPDRKIALGVKRAADVLVATGALIVGAPLLALIAIAIKRHDGGPVLFKQERVGLHGRRFQLIKFRTMVVDAESRLEELQAQNERRGAVFKMTVDPRVTSVGRTLRRLSFDELPQLWNVVRGEMSLIGPRPPLPAEVLDYDRWHRRKLSMKPGITGLWQVEARSEPDFDRLVEKDLEYIDRWSLWLDIKIALKTIPAMARGEGR